MTDICRDHDFRKQEDIVECEHVLYAVALTVQWFNEHPEMIVAAWLKTGCVRPEWYEAEGLGEVCQKAQNLLANDKTYLADMKEHMLSKRLWDYKDVSMQKACLKPLLAC